jgi:hypothetical protein
MSYNRGTNPFFNQYKNTGEQDLYEALIIEAIGIYGLDCYYLPALLENYDPLFGESPLKEYNTYYPVELYIKSVDGFEGDGTYLSKFGLEIHDQIVFTLARRTFDREVGSINGMVRPNEGDIIWYPLNNKPFQIKYVNYLPIHYPLGALYTYDLTCELYSYDNSKFSTGITGIDSLMAPFSTNILDYNLIDENGNYIEDENGNYIVDEAWTTGVANTATIGDDSYDVGSESNAIIDFSEHDPFSQGEV